MPNPTTPKPTRHAARAVVIDQLDRILLIKIVDASVGSVKGAKWITPGGKCEAGETAEQAVVREIEEETGISSYQLGPQLWHGEHVIAWKGVPTKIIEDYFLVRVVTESDHIDSSALEESEREVFKSHRWWTLTELQQTNEIILPTDMVALLPDILNGSLPDTVFTIDLRTPEERG